MTQVIKLKKGLDINLLGRAEMTTVEMAPCGVFGFVPDDFVGMKPKMMVKEGDKVKVGDVLFVNKQYEDVKFVSSVSGTVTAIERGDRRKVLCVKVESDGQMDCLVDNDLKANSREEVVALLADKGLLGYINQMPYAISANNVDLPQAVFISTFRDMPLSADVDYCIADDLMAFKTGVETLAKVAHVYLNVKKGSKMDCDALKQAGNDDVTVTLFEGKCPAGNVNVQINHIKPINKGDIVWTVEPEVVVFIGRLINNGHVDFTKKVAVCGSEVKTPIYNKVLVGQNIGDILEGNIDDSSHKRIINGNVLTGKKTSSDGFVGAHAYEVTVIPEGDDNDEMLGWIMPRVSQFSTSRSYMSWLFGKKDYKLDARIKGGKRHMIMSGEYDKVLPMDIMSEYLIKAIITCDIDKMEQLGIYEVAPEDFALAEFADSSKLELQRIVREGLDMLRKENE
ncbi:MAG: Na(+)-translocating NADH-quinone reductase subunit A [Prevotellaceae bacterium]|nr:Na(+)-translocating NADH-quinone reductase subunit A [Prevotellaceae bacterium]